MSRGAALWALALAISVAAIAAYIWVALSPASASRPGSWGDYMNYKERFEISLYVGSGSGSAQLNLGKVALPRGAVIAKLALLSSEGVESLVVSGELALESSKGSYRISMPCAISANEPCYRVLALLPGYDVPMKIDGGIYEVKLSLDWWARGSGYIQVMLELSASPEQ